MLTNQTIYDVAIIGSGIAGSTLGTILARQGLNVLIFEAKSHPRFSIGESMILETSESMRGLAELYDVPELAYFSSENYFPYIGTNHGIKRHFSYMHHTEGKMHVPASSLQAVIPKYPHGHELHLYRQDVDYFLMTCAVRYGATVLQNTPIYEFEIGSEDVTLTTVDGEIFSAKYLVDASGFRSLLADKFDLRDYNLQTHSRAIFTHMVDVFDFHEVGTSQQEADLPYSVTEGTLHHVFEGGWLWVIPFNNHPSATNSLCSVGLMLDPRIHPTQHELSAEEEFFAFIERFPSVAAQFREARSVRDWVRSGRIQYSSKQIVGDRWALLGHAAGFIDPLYSKGLYISLNSVAILAHHILRGHEDGNFSRERFMPLEKATLAFLHSNDRLVANSYRSWSHHSLWNRYSVLWLLGAYTELVKLFSIRIDATRNGTIVPEQFINQLQGLKLSGGGFTGYDQVADQINQIVEGVNLSSTVEIEAAVTQIRDIFDLVDWMPVPFQKVLDGQTHLPKNKLRLDLLKRDKGFLRGGEYRRHFFGEHSMFKIGRAFLAETIRYSKPAVNWKRRTELRQRHQPRIITPRQRALNLAKIPSI